MQVVDAALHCFDVGALVKHPVMVDARFQKLLDLAKEQRARQMADDLMSVSTNATGWFGFSFVTKLG